MVTIREAEPADWPAIAEFLGRPPKDGPSLHRWTESEYAPPITLVAEHANTLIGAAVGGLSRTANPSTPDGPSARLSFIGIAPRHRRRGHATALLDAFIAEVRSYRPRRLAAVVEGSQPEALAFFRKHAFETDQQTLALLRPPADLPSPNHIPATLRPLSLADLPSLMGLLIRLGLERAEAPHDALEALTPASLEHWLQRTGTVAYAAWDPADTDTPLGLAWATRRQDDAVLRFVGVEDDHRRAGIGTALLASIVDITQRRPLRATLSDPDPVAPFFRALAFEVERVTYEMSRAVT